MTLVGAAATMYGEEHDHNTPNVDIACARAILRGLSPQDAAEVYGISVRTAYRWRRELVAIESVCVGRWVATYALRRSSPPVRLTAWELA